jgi:hypothetical protein
MADCRRKTHSLASTTCSAPGLQTSKPKHRHRQTTPRTRLSSRPSLPATRTWSRIPRRDCRRRQIPMAAFLESQKMAVPWKALRRHRNSKIRPRDSVHSTRQRISIPLAKAPRWSTAAQSPGSRTRSALLHDIRFTPCLSGHTLFPLPLCARAAMQLLQSDETSANRKPAAERAAQHLGPARRSTTQCRCLFSLSHPSAMLL